MKRQFKTARMKQKTILNKLEEKLLKDINFKKVSLDNELNKEIQKAESEIKELRARAPEKINKIAVEASADLLHQLIGTEVNNSSISAIVDDFQKRRWTNIMAIDATFWVAISFCNFYWRINLSKNTSKN